MSLCRPRTGLSQHDEEEEEEEEISEDETGSLCGCRNRSSLWLEKENTRHEFVEAYT